MQPGSAAIIVDYFDTRMNVYSAMDGTMWRQLGGVLTQHYFFTKDEVVLPEQGDIKPSAEGLDPFLLYRNHGRVRVDPERMLVLVENAATWIRRDAGRIG